MMADTRVLHSDYLHYLRIRPVARFSLEASGMPNCSLSDLGILPDQLMDEQADGRILPLRERIADRFKLDPAYVRFTVSF